MCVNHASRPLLPFRRPAARAGWCRACWCSCRKPLTPAAALPSPCSQGGLVQGMLVQLQNQQMALLVEVGEGSVTLDANSMLAGKTLTFFLELLDIQAGPGGAEAA